MDGCLFAAPAKKVESSSESDGSLSSDDDDEPLVKKTDGPPTVSSSGWQVNLLARIPHCAWLLGDPKSRAQWGILAPQTHPSISLSRWICFKVLSMSL